MRAILHKALRLIHAIEEGVLALLLLGMIGLAALDILLRMLTGGGLVWVSPLVRIMVLWLGLLGALLATRDNQHIAIDILARLLSDGLRRWANSLTALFAAVVCAVAAVYSIEFVHGSFEFQDTVMSGVPAWTMQLILPLSFALMSLRFAVHSLGYALLPDYRSAVQQEQEQEAQP